MRPRRVHQSGEQEGRDRISVGGCETGMRRPYEMCTEQAEELRRSDDLEVSAHPAGQFVGQGASIPQVEPERVYCQAEEVRSAACDERCVELALDVVGGRPEVRRTDDRGDRLGAGLHPGVTGPRLIVVVEDDSTGTQAVDVRRDGPSRIWDLGG